MSPAVGVTFPCTSPLASGDTVTWQATITDEDTVNVQSVNLLTSDDLTTIEAEAVHVLEEQVGGTLGTQNVDCGGGPIVLGADATVLCALTDPANGDVCGTTLTITDINRGVSDIVVADTPRESSEPSFRPSRPNRMRRSEGASGRARRPRDPLFPAELSLRAFGCPSIMSSAKLGDLVAHRLVRTPAGGDAPLHGTGGRQPGRISGLEPPIDRNQLVVGEVAERPACGDEVGHQPADNAVRFAEWHPPRHERLGEVEGSDPR